MSVIKIFGYIVMFLIAGELLIRLDEAEMPFASDDQFRVEIKLQESPELQMLDNQGLMHNDSILRVMILGDSYIMGPGIRHDQRFAQLLRRQLLDTGTMHQYKKCLVLDVSRAANNNLDNYNTYHAFVGRFNPQLTILAYNHNDVENDLVGNGEMINHAMPAKQKPRPTLVKSIFDVVYLSHAVRFTMRNINMFLKSRGYLVPHSVLDENLRAYTEDQPNWVQSKKILSRLISEARAGGHGLMVMQMPEFNLVGRPQLFAKADSTIASYFADQHVPFVNPLFYYGSRDPADVVITRYDGHSNALGHRILADSLVQYLRRNWLTNGRWE